MGHGTEVKIINKEFHAAEDLTVGFKNAHRYLNASAAALYLGTTPAVLYQWVHSKNIPYIKLGGKKQSAIRFDIKDLDRFMNEHRNKA